MPITIEAIQAKQTELAAMIQALQSQSAAAVTYVEIEEIIFELRAGEHYAGAVLDEDGDHEHHLVLMAPRPDKSLNWQSAMDWAASVGGSLPSRQEQALLFANCKQHLKHEWHWSSQTHKDDASSAWGCYFYHGGQHYDHKSYEGSAVCVRRSTPVS